MKIKKQDMRSINWAKKHLSIKQNRKYDHFLEFVIQIDIKNLLSRISFSVSFRRTSEIDDSNTRSRRENFSVVNETLINAFFFRSHWNRRHTWACAYTNHFIACQSHWKSRRDLNNLNLESWFSIVDVLNFRKIEFRANNLLDER